MSMLHNHKNKFKTGALLFVVALASQGMAQGRDIASRQFEQSKYQALWNSASNTEFTAGAVAGAARVGATVAKVVAKVAPKVIKAGAKAIQTGAKFAKTASKALNTASNLTSNLMQIKQTIDSATQQPTASLTSENAITVAKAGYLSDEELLAFTSDMEQQGKPEASAELKKLNEEAKAKAKEAAAAERDYMLNLEMKQILDRRLLDALDKLDKDQPVDLDRISDGLEAEAKANLVKTKQKLSQRPAHNPKAVAPAKMTRAAGTEEKAAKSLEETVVAGDKFATQLTQVAEKREAKEAFDDDLSDLTSIADEYNKETIEDDQFEEMLLSQEEDFGDLFYSDGDIDPELLDAGDVAGGGDELGGGTE